MKNLTILSFAVLLLAPMATIQAAPPAAAADDSTYRGWKSLALRIGLDSHAGWAATVDGLRGAVFVQRFVI